MKIVSRILSFVILPLCTLILFITIGIISGQSIYAKEGSHPTMTGGISAIAWTYRGIYSAILIILISSVMFSKLSIIVKTFKIALILLANLPFIIFADYLFYFRLLLLAIPIVNFVILTPIFAVLKVNQGRYKEDEDSGKLE